MTPREMLAPQPAPEPGLHSVTDWLLELTPPEHCHHLTVEQMADDSTTVFIARDGGAAIACGAHAAAWAPVSPVPHGRATSPRRPSPAP